MDGELRDLVNTSNMAQVAKMVTKLKSVPASNGTMFDNTTNIYMPETGAGHHGPDTEAPMAVMPRLVLPSPGRLFDSLKPLVQVDQLQLDASVLSLQGDPGILYHVGNADQPDT